MYNYIKASWFMVNKLTRGFRESLNVKALSKSIINNNEHTDKLRRSAQTAATWCHHARFLLPSSVSILVKLHRTRNDGMDRTVQLSS